MFKFKDSVPSPSVPKRTITISGVSITGTTLSDEDGSIIDRIKDALPDGVTEFSLKITVELPDDGSVES